jgi:hypothetical protein
MRFTCRFLAAVCCLVLGLSSLVSAETVLQSNPYSVGGSFPQTLNWNKFDPSLGTLTGVSLAINGTSSGYVLVQNTGVDVLYISGFYNKVRLTFSGTISNPGSQTSANTLISTDPSIAQLPAFSAEQFNLHAEALTGLSNDLTAFLSYFTGPGSFTTDIFQLPSVGSSNGDATDLENSSLATGGVVSIVYTYSPVPEPSTYALAALGLGIAGFVRARRRKSVV